MKERKSYEIAVKGRVQGIGFRPFIHRLALKYRLEGFVQNTASGVSIVCSVEVDQIGRLKREIVEKAPVVAGITDVQVRETRVNGFHGFTILGSDPGNTEITEISPDIAVCEQCLDDMRHQAHRLRYPFINCTHCGPRFTIIRDLPYDRPLTTMDVFKMCETCATEYNNLTDRRYHAQPVACNHCGPHYSYRSHTEKAEDPDAIIVMAAADLDAGRILAVKGLGGYHLICDALNQAAVQELRLRKHRDSKPFAVLFRNREAVEAYCHLDKAEEEILLSWRRPVVLLREKKTLAPAVSNGLTTVGALLPYMPLHYLLFEKLKTAALVFTSGNLSDDPTLTDDREATEKLAPLSDAVIGYNREIHNRADDSVVRIAGKSTILIRRSRGYAPSPVYTDTETEGILAVGAEQKNTFCLGKGRMAIPSQHIGDLKSLETCLFFQEAIDRFSRLFRFRPDLVACDLHPDYHSTAFAEALAVHTGIPLLRVQHHHAHIVSCMAENALHEPVIGISFDGTGFGMDGHTWGGEFFVAEREDFERITHFDYVPMPGGDKVVAEPWRMAYSYLKTLLPDNQEIEQLPFLKDIRCDSIEIVGQMIDMQINAPLTSGAGRLFDAVAALCGICTRPTFDAEAAMRLESAADPKVTASYPFDTSQTISFARMFPEILRDLEKADISVISAKFHNTVAAVILHVSEKIRKERGLSKVVLSGGVFQNRYLLEKSVFLLEERHFSVYTHRQVPANDGGISLGQLVVASEKRRLCV